MAPYFVIRHPSRGQFPGPYTRLPNGSPIRKLALDVVATIAISSANKEELFDAVGIATYDTEELDYWVHLQSAIG